MHRQPHLDAPPVRRAYATDPQRRPHCQLTAVVRYGTTALCGDCDTRRSTVGKEHAPRRLTPRAPVDVLTWLSDSNQHLHQAHLELAAAVHRARLCRHSWTTIGSILNITRQAAQQRFTQDQHGEG